MYTMISKWYELKSRAIKMRQQGQSLKKIEAKLGVPRSTLSGWLRHVKLTSIQKAKIDANQKEALAKARMHAVHWHNEQKRSRIAAAQTVAEETMQLINTADVSVLKIVAAALYIGEGRKTRDTSMGSSDPLILQFFVAILQKAYWVEQSKIKCELHLRADQNEAEIKQFWMKALGLPEGNFMATIKDQRTVGTVTYPYYKGVCNVRCGNVAIQRELLHLSKLFFAEVAKQPTNNN